jgi:hypothetical protein
VGTTCNDGGCCAVRAHPDNSALCPAGTMCLGNSGCLFCPTVSGAAFTDGSTTVNETDVDCGGDRPQCAGGTRLGGSCQPVG